MPLYVITAHAAVSMYSASTNKKLICRKETMRCFLTFKISVSHSRSLEMTPFSIARVSSY